MTTYYEKINTEVINLRMSGKEFRFVRENAGLTMEQFADYVGLHSRTTIYYWEKQEMMKPYQVDLLRHAVKPYVWKECRNLWNERQKS